MKQLGQLCTFNFEAELLEIDLKNLQTLELNAVYVFATFLYPFIIWVYLKILPG